MTRKDGTDLLGVLVQVSVVAMLVCVIPYSRKFLLFSLPALISKIFVQQFLSHVEYVEPMVTFATWPKIHSTEYFCNAKIAGLSGIFCPMKFLVVQYIWTKLML